MTLRIDTHNHGLISLHPKWQKLQGYCDRNILQLWFDKCIEKQIDICAVTSERWEIPSYSYHDRLNYLLKNYAAKLPKEYAFGKLGRNAVIIEKEGKKVVFINGQTVIVVDHGAEFDHLVIGGNDIINGREWDYTLKSISDKGYISITEHPFANDHFGLGEEFLEHLLIQYPENIDAIEGVNAQFIIPEKYRLLPIIGKYNKGINKKACLFTYLKKYVPYTSASDAHSIDSITGACIETEEKINTSSDLDLTRDLKNIIRSGKFNPVENYTDLKTWLKWTTQFNLGVSLGYDVKTQPHYFTMNQ